MTVAGRLRGIPWGEIWSDAAGRFLIVAMAACAVHVFKTYVCGVALVKGPSMLPTLNTSGDVVAVERVSTRAGSIAVGDVVLLRSPENPVKIVAKRVTGLEGDTVSVPSNPGGSMDGRWPGKQLVVPKGHVWVQGDNMQVSRDSRQFGPVPYGLIQGRAFLRIWPPKCFGPVSPPVAI